MSIDLFYAKQVVGYIHIRLRFLRGLHGPLEFSAIVWRINRSFSDFP